MMRKYYLFIICLFSTCRAVYAQDVAPGEQAKGYLNDKNVSVDHSSGTFHYKVPLFELKSGNFTLPVELSYSGSGVRFYGRSGNIGHNWSLLCGGIVTRTVRGGISDEINGIADPVPGAPPLGEDVKNVNLHKRDGESDLFTAVFNGRSVNFIIRSTGRAKFAVEPLEKTDVKIEQIGLNYPEGWIVTDENGVRYVYNIIERTVNYTKQEIVGMNNLANRSFTSSWYLSRIEIPGADPIRFEYDPRFGNVNARNVTSYTEPVEMNYQYGRPLQEHPFDFKRYKAQFDEQIATARYYLGGAQPAALEGMLNALAIFDRNYNMFVPDYSSYFFNFEIYRLNEKIMGILSDFSEVSSASSNLLEALNNLIDVCKMSCPAAISSFEQAKIFVIRCLEEVDYITEKKTKTSSYYRVTPPLLTKISNGVNSVRFHYPEGNVAFKLDSITWVDGIGGTLRSVVLNRPVYLLKSIVWKGEDHAVYQRQDFTYHLENFTDYAMDSWGYYCFDPKITTGYDPSVCYAKRYSLQTVTLPTGGTITVDYENNRYKNIHVPASEIDYGGIRVKSIVLNDDNGQSDEIRYLYPKPGATVYWNIDNVAELVYRTGNYGTFMDVVSSSLPFFYGNVFVGGGNNGLYYPYVEEEFVGKGKNSYLFSVPNVADPLVMESAPYWLCGLPLAKAVYDNTGNLVRMQKNKYYADLDSHPEFGSPYPGSSVELGNWCDMNIPAPFRFSKSMLQVRADQFYMDEEALSAHYMHHSRDTLYCDRGVVTRINLHSEVFQKNILPRVTPELSEQRYYIYYGGKVVPAGQKEYSFPPNTSASSSIVHLTGDLPAQHVLETDIQYVYDNPEYSTSPSRIIRRYANGDEQVTVKHTVNDFEDAAGAMIKVMRQRNLKAPVIKEQVWVKKGGSSRYNLKEETLNLFQLQERDSVVLPLRRLNYAVNGTYGITAFPSGRQNTFFTFAEAQYKEIEHDTYKWIGNNCLPAEIASLTDVKCYIFDSLRSNLIMQTTGTTSSSICAVDRYRHKQVQNRYDEATFSSYENVLWNIHEDIVPFLALNDALDVSALTPGSRAFYDGESYRRILDFARKVSKCDGDVSWVSRHDLLLDDIMMGFLRSDLYYEMEVMYEDPQRLYDIVQRMCEVLDIVYFFPEVEELMKTGINLDEMGATLPGRLSIVSDGVHQKYRLYYVIWADEPVWFDSRFVFVKGENDSELLEGEWVILKPGCCNVVSREIDISNYSGVTKIYTEDRLLYGSDIVLAVLVPDGVPFEATASDLSGRVVCKLNQNGQLEYYEYDTAGRVTAVYDQDSNLIKENQYHLKN